MEILIAFHWPTLLGAGTRFVPPHLEDALSVDNRTRTHRLKSIGANSQRKMLKKLYMPPARMAVVFQGRSNRRQWFFSVAALFLLGWSLLLTSEKNVRFTSPYHTNPERPHTSSPFRFNSSADILSFYGSGSAFKERLASYLPGQKKYHQGQQPEYSIKPIVYIFPQFHAIPENDKFWGKNFTEWTNVNKITLNKYGIEVQHPSEEIGQYNLLDLSTRQRYTQTLKNSRLDFHSCNVLG